MKYRPSKAFIACMTLLLGAGGAMGWGWNKASRAPERIRADGRFFWALNVDPVERYPSIEDRRRLREPVEQEMRALEAEFPALSVEMHPVPETENGYLQMHLLSGGGQCCAFPGDAEFREYLNYPYPWNPETARMHLAKNAGLVERVERIAAMKQQSCAGMPDDYRGFIAGIAPKFCSTILLTKARLAAEEHDEPATLHYVELAGRLANHYHDVETPCLLAETVRMMIDLEVQGYAFTYLLPALGNHADLARWKTVLSRYRYSPADFADVMRGEFQTSARHLLLPIILNDQNPDRPGDAKDLSRIYAASFDAAVTRLQTISCVEWAANPGVVEPPSYAGLSREGRAVMAMMFVNNKAWNERYLRAITVLSQYQAALDILAAERRGLSTPGGPLADGTRDPIDGQPFVFDMAHRTLGVRETAEDRKIDPVRLPW